MLNGHAVELVSTCLHFYLWLSTALNWPEKLLAVAVIERHITEMSQGVSVPKSEVCSNPPTSRFREHHSLDNSEERREMLSPGQDMAAILTSEQLWLSAQVQTSHWYSMDWGGGW